MATVGISQVRRQAEKVQAPRFLHCEFPLGRPLGRPNDVAFQTDVIRRAFSLLGRTDVPVLEDHPEVIEDDADGALSCVVPPRLDPTLHAAVSEAQALRPAYNRSLERTGRTAMGRQGGPDAIGSMISQFIRICEGASFEEVGLDSNSALSVSQDIRAYYEEAALALADHVPAARQIETWMYKTTEAGQVLRSAARALKKSGASYGDWNYLVPGNQHY